MEASAGTAAAGGEGMELMSAGAAGGEGMELMSAGAAGGEGMELMSAGAAGGEGMELMSAGAAGGEGMELMSAGAAAAGGEVELSAGAAGGEGTELMSAGAAGGEGIELTADVLTADVLTADVLTAGEGMELSEEAAAAEGAGCGTTLGFEDAGLSQPSSIENKDSSSSGEGSRSAFGGNDEDATWTVTGVGALGGDTDALAGLGAGGGLAWTVSSAPGRIEGSFFPSGVFRPST